MKYIVALLVLWAFSPANSQFLNKIVSESNEGTVYSYAVLSDEKLLYQTVKNNVYSLWSMDLNSKIKENIFSTPNNTSIRQLRKLSQHVYFVARSENYEYHLWQSDGTKIGTIKVSDEALGGSGTFSVVNDNLFVQNTDLQILQLKDGKLINHEVVIETLRHICVFNSNNFIVQVKNEPDKSHTFKRLNNGEFNDVYEYSSANNFQAGFFNVNDSCFFRYIDDETRKRKIITIPRTGNPYLFNAEIDMRVISYLFVHQDRVYAIAGNVNAHNSMYRLTDDLKDYDATVTISNGYSFSGASSKNHIIASVATQNGYEPYSTALFLDSDLNILPTYYSYFQAYYPGAYEVGSDVLIGFNDYREGAIIQTISATNEVSLLTIEEHGISTIITNENTDQIYLNLYDDNTKTSNIYSFNDQPVLNDLINGTWHEPDIINQGLVIQKGRRHNGSEYVFVTFYTFDQGEPLWLAGVSDLLPEQQQLEITLYAYDGIQLFEFDATPNREEFGQLKLEMETCDKLTATISSDDYNQSINLYRIDDTSYKYLCADIRTLEIDESNKTVLQLEVGYE